MPTTPEEPVHVWKATRNSWTKITPEKYARLRAIGEQVRKVSPTEARKLCKIPTDHVHPNDMGLYDDC